MSDYSGDSSDAGHEALLQKAAAEVRRKKKGLHEAARDYDLDPSTLHRRVHGTHQPYKLAHAARQLLTPAQERVLTEWVVYYARSGHPLSQQAARIKAALIIDGKLPSKKWYKSFLKRHPKLSDSRLQALDPKRARAFNPAIVDRFFSRFAGFVAEHDIPPEHIWNMDEKGLQLNGGRKGDRTKYLVERKTAMNYKSQSDDIRMVTVIECVSTEGNRVPPTFIFKGARVQKRWFPQSSEYASEMEDAIVDDSSDEEDDMDAQPHPPETSRELRSDAGDGEDVDIDADDEESDGEEDRDDEAIEDEDSMGDLRGEEDDSEDNLNDGLEYGG